MPALRKLSKERYISSLTDCGTAPQTGGVLVGKSVGKSYCLS